MSLRFAGLPRPLSCPLAVRSFIIHGLLQAKRPDFRLPSEAAHYMAESRRCQPCAILKNRFVSVFMIAHMRGKCNKFLGPLRPGHGVLLTAFLRQRAFFQ